MDLIIEEAVGLAVDIAETVITDKMIKRKNKSGKK